MSVLLGNGDGTFQAKVDHPTAPGPSSVAAADVNGDGKPDVVVAATTAGMASVLLGNGDGTFQDRADYPAGAGAIAVAAADLTGDGMPDLVIASSFSNTTTVLIATCLPRRGRSCPAERFRLVQLDEAVARPPAPPRPTRRRRARDLRVIWMGRVTVSGALRSRTGSPTLRRKSTNGPEEVSNAPLRAEVRARRAWIRSTRIASLHAGSG